MRACFVRCARAGSCGGSHDFRVAAAQRALDEAEASNNPIDIEEAAAAVAAAKGRSTKTSGRKRKAGRLATHISVCMHAYTVYDS